MSKKLNYRKDNILYWWYKALYLNYWDLYGRACLKEFLSLILLHVVAGVIFSPIYFFYIRFESDFLIQLTYYSLVYFYIILTAVPTFTMHIRRLHDAGRSGWWHPLGVGFITNISVGPFFILIVFIYALVVLLFYNGNSPIEQDVIELLISVLLGAIGTISTVCIFAGIIFLFSDSQEGSNKWGENPKEKEIFNGSVN